MSYVKVTLPFTGTTPATSFIHACRELDLGIIFMQPLNIVDNTVTFEIEEGDVVDAQILYGARFESVESSMIILLNR